MLSKFIVLFALMAAASASGLSSFSYGVADPYTGDYKNQVETRAGGNVAGQYSLLDSDGTRRVVDYAAGANGFNAIVRKDPAVIAAPVYRSYPAYSAYPNYAYNPYANYAGIGYAGYGIGYGAYPYGRYV